MRQVSLEPQVAVEVQGARQVPSTQSLPPVQCSGAEQLPDGRGRQRPDWQLWVAPHWLSLEQP